MTKRGSHRTDCGSDGPLRLPTAHLRRHHIVMRIGKPKQLRRHLPIQRKRRPVAGSRTKRILVGDIICGEHKLHIVGQWLSICPKPQTERRRHRYLKMRISRHKLILMLLWKGLQPPEKPLHCLRDSLQLIAEKQLQVYEHLIIARTPRMYLLSDIPKTRSQQELHLRMHILHSLLNDELAALYRVGDILQSRKQHVKLLLREKTYLLEHLYVGHWALHVITRKAKVEFPVTTHRERLYKLVRLKAFVP